MQRSKKCSFLVVVVQFIIRIIGLVTSYSFERPPGIEWRNTP